MSQLRIDMWMFASSAIYGLHIFLDFSRMPPVCALSSILFSESVPVARQAVSNKLPYGP